jgi:hypothetical protein
MIRRLNVAIYEINGIHINFLNCIIAPVCVRRVPEEIAISDGLCYHCTLEDGGKHCR